jgi:Transposase DDE domain
MDSYGRNCTESTVKSGHFRKPQVKFFVTLFTTILVVCGKVNFTNLSRYSDLNEKTYRRHFQQAFDFTGLNVALVEQERSKLQPLLLVMDNSYIAKSGKATAGIDWYWNGCHSRSEKGLEVSLVGVVNVETEVAYAVSAQQTLASVDLPPDVTRLDQSWFHLEHVRPQLPKDVGYLAVDGADAKEPFVTGALHLDLQVISKLRCDANLRYLYTGVQKPRGRPRKYDGKVDFQDLSRLSWVETVQPGLDLYTAVVWSVALKRAIRLVYLLDTHDPKKSRYALLCSTDIQQSALDIYSLYSLRFQIEFLFRNAKQFTGLQDCQARSLPKLDFHFNACFTTLNLARVQTQHQHQGDPDFSLSMASVKRCALNDHLLERFIRELELDSTAIKSHPNYQNLRQYGIIAA